jgi:hypothetical protein
MVAYIAKSSISKISGGGGSGSRICTLENQQLARVAVAGKDRPYYAIVHGGCSAAWFTISPSAPPASCLQTIWRVCILGSVFNMLTSPVYAMPCESGEQENAWLCLAVAHYRHKSPLHA